MTTTAQDRKCADLQLCAMCGQPCPPLAVEAGDPYCSARCAKRAHGVRDSFDGTRDPGDTLPGKPQQHRRQMQRAWRRTFHAWAERRTNRRALAGAEE